MRRLLSNQFVRSIGGVGGAALLAQLIGLLAAPIAARLFSQGDFGRFGLFFSLANVLVTLALFGLTDALIAARSDEDARLLRAGTMYSIGVMTPLLGLATFGLIQLHLFGYGALPRWSALLMVLEVGVIAGVMVLQMWLIRRRGFRRIAYGHVTQGVFRAAGQIGAGFLGLGYVGLAVADGFARTAVIVVLQRDVFHDLRAALAVSLRDAVRAVWRYRLFPLFRTPSTFANNLGTALPPALVAMAYGVSAAGLYSLMSTVIVAPIALVQKAVGDVFLGHFAEQFHDDPRAARQFLLRVGLGLAAVAAIPAVILALWGEPVFALLFGEKWRTAGALASRMAPALAADMAIGTLGSALNVVNRPDAKLGFDVARVGGYVAAYAIAKSMALPLEGMVVLIARFAVLSYAVYAALIYFGTKYPRPVSTVSGDLQAI
jgi:O-antigen/teichoic acid export membrane protein